MSENWVPPQPGAEHAVILASVGKWDVDCKHFMDPSAPPAESKGTDTVAALGGFWTTSCFEGSVMGMPFTGVCTVGYDTTRQKYVTTWIDSMMSYLWFMEGDMGADGKTLDFTGPGPAYGCDGTTPWRIQWVLESKDRHLMRMFMTMPDGGEMMTMENTYRRRKS